MTNKGQSLRKLQIARHVIEGPLDLPDEDKDRINQASEDIKSQDNVEGSEEGNFTEELDMHRWLKLYAIESEVLTLIYFLLDFIAK